MTEYFTVYPDGVLDPVLVFFADAVSVNEVPIGTAKYPFDPFVNVELYVSELKTYAGFGAVTTAAATASFVLSAPLSLDGQWKRNKVKNTVIMTEIFLELI
ncbi:MAG TPA: hypothetical protein PL048_07340, partial [Leptospiraceae bacterium]|nr:hypothetical protein [Leptospiraceae bacterium]